MSAPVLLNLSNKLGKEIKCEAFSQRVPLYKSMNVRFFFSYDIKL